MIHDKNLCLKTVLSAAIPLKITKYKHLNAFILIHFRLNQRNKGGKIQLFMVQLLE